MLLIFDMSVGLSINNSIKSYLPITESLSESRFGVGWGCSFHFDFVLF
jgi:hypothetical protein